MNHGFTFLSNWLPRSKVYFPTPLLDDHVRIAKRARVSECGSYPYNYNLAKNTIDLPVMLDFLEEIDSYSIIVLHASGNRPTGSDPSQAEWNSILNVCKKKEHLPFFLSNYQGIVSGDPALDAYPMRRSLEDGMQFAVGNTFSSNMGLYGERIGSFSLVCADAPTANKVRSQMAIQARRFYSSAPLHGARIVGRVMQTPAYYNLWLNDMREIASRIQSVREGLYSRLVKLHPTEQWEHLKKQKGFFSALGLSADQCKRLCEERNVYVPETSCIHLAGINSGNIDYVAKAIHDVC